jgi:hypothetical protein
MRGERFFLRMYNLRSRPRQSVNHDGDRTLCVRSQILYPKSIQRFCQNPFPSLLHTSINLYQHPPTQPVPSERPHTPSQWNCPATHHEIDTYLSPAAQGTYSSTFSHISSSSFLGYLYVLEVREASVARYSMSRRRISEYRFERFVWAWEVYVPR